MFKALNKIAKIARSYRRYINKPVFLSNGRYVGILSAVKISRSTGKLISIEIKGADGSVKEISADGNRIQFANDKVVINLPLVELEYTPTLNMIRQEVLSIRSKLREINEKLVKLSSLLIDGKIDVNTFNEIKSRFEREHRQLVSLCKEKIDRLNDVLRDIDARLRDFERRRSELTVKRVIEMITPDEERELGVIEDALTRLSKVRHEVRILRLELETECMD